MAETPLVSIGLPVYNSERTLARAIESLLAQDHANLELIISDNASTDGTRAVCAHYAQQDSRIRYIRNATNIGMNANFFQVLQAARGPFFMWAAADDAWAAGFISRLLKELERFPSAAVAMSAVQLIDEEETPLGILR